MALLAVMRYEIIIGGGMDWKMGGWNGDQNKRSRLEVTIASFGNRGFCLDERRIVSAITLYQYRYSIVIHLLELTICINYE
jgi:hypothetical protein